MRALVVSTLLLAASASGGGSAPAPVLEFLAGDMRGMGTVDGTGPAARFNIPGGVATDAAGNVYVADRRNHTIRKITPAGVVTTLAGRAGAWGSIDGIGAAACFDHPGGIAADSAGNLYVADTDNSTIRKVTPGGVVSTFAGTARVKGSADGAGAAARFNSPAALAADGAGNIYVADSRNNTIRKITPGGMVTTLAGRAGASGATDGIAEAARFDSPSGVATDGAGNVYVADSSNHAIRKITPAGVVTTLAGTAGAMGSSDGAGAAARFTGPVGVAIDGTGNLYVADSENYTIRKITPAAVVTTLAGMAGASGSADGTGPAARFYVPQGIALDSAGNLFVADMFNYAIRKITPAGMVTTFAGAAPVTGSTDGQGAAARFGDPLGIAADGAGNVYVADYINHTIRKITSGGAVTTLAGSTGVKGSIDASGAAARFDSPGSVAADGAGNVYVADGGHIIRKITRAGVVTTFAGMKGREGSVDATGSSARFGHTTGLATDVAGNVYVADYSNNTIRKITPAGAVTTLAGTAGAKGNADGIGPAARFDGPFRLATDGAGNIYVADHFNYAIRKITPAGLVTTLAGKVGEKGHTDGPGPTARFGDLLGIAVDSVGNVYAADWSSHTVRKIAPEGVVSTIVGVAGVPDFIQGALPGRIARPLGVAVSGQSLYITLQNGIAVVRNLP